MKNLKYSMAAIAFCLMFLISAKTFRVGAQEIEPVAASTNPETVTAAPVTKEVSVSKTPFIDASNNLILRFGSFSDAGYRYKLTRNSDNKSVSGTIDKGATSVKISLKGKGIYKQNAGYKLVVTSADKERKVTTRYYTGISLSGLTLTHRDDNSVKAAWTTKGKNYYTGYVLDTSKTTGGAKPLYRSFVSGKSGTIAASGLTDGKYYISVIAYKTIGKYKHYGQRLTKSIDYKKGLPKVTGLTAEPGNGKADLKWNPVKDAETYTVYRSTSSGGPYASVADNIRETAFTDTKVTGGKTYYYKVKAFNKTYTGFASSAASAKVPVVAGKVSKIDLKLNSKDELSVSWKKVSKASFYRVYYKEKIEGTHYAKLADPTSCIQSLAKLDPEKTYLIVVYSFTKVGSKSYRTKSGSNEITVKPREYMEKNYNKLLASKVRTITYYKTKCDYTTRKYSTATKTAFVNYKGYTSPTNYLIWISHYTQQVTVFKGSKGKWKMIRTFICGTGTARNHSPRGIFKIQYKERGWYYVNTKELYISHYAGRNSFHTRPLYNGGGVANATIGRPCSHGCVRCYNADAKYIYDKMPLNTTVVSY
ncbi:MAG: L,D-transpeptidase family protein [Eubacterium sp.]|nr:L,D-transpeptidase family protein [Eubacterium sp.]